MLINCAALVDTQMMYTKYKNLYVSVLSVF